MRSALKLIFPLSLPLFFTSCEKELDFEYHDIPAIQVAEVFLNQEGAYAKLTHTTPMDEPLDTIGETVGAITLTDLTDNISYRMLPDGKGIYRSEIPGIPGHEYGICIEREGLTLRAAAVMTPEVPIVDLSFTSYKMPYGDSGLLLARFADIHPEVGTCYWIRLLRNGKVWKWSTATDHGAIQGIVTSIFMLGKIEEEPEDEDDLADGEVITALITQISRDFYDYLIAVSNDSSGPRMFEGGNCLGFFLPAFCSQASATYRLEEILPGKHFAKD